MLSQPLLQTARPERRRPALWVALLGIVSATAIVYACSKVFMASDRFRQIEHIHVELDVPAGSFVVPPACLYEMAGVALGGTALLAGVVAVIPALGFTEGGVEAESAAAAWQATMGNVEKESLFAIIQSLAARGQLLRILTEGLPLVGNLAVASGAFCSKLEDIERSITGGTQVIANMTSTALEQIERASKDSSALEQVRKASKDATKMSKEVMDKAYNATMDAAEKAWGAMTSGSPSRQCWTRSTAMAFAVVVAVAILIT